MGRFIGKPERSLRELYGDDPERADALAWGRRGALGGAALAAMGAALGAAVPFGRPHAGGTAAGRPRPARPGRRGGSGGGARCSGWRARRRWSCSASGRWSPKRRKPCWTTRSTPAAKMFVRNNGGVPDAPRRSARPGSSASTARWSAPGARGRGAGGRALPAGDAPAAAGMRRQWPLLLRARDARQPVGQWRRRPAASGRACAWRDLLRAAGLKESGEVHRPFRRRPAPLGRPGPAGDQPRHADREGDGRGHAGRLPPERASRSRCCTARRCGWSCRAGRARSARNG